MTVFPFHHVSFKDEITKPSSEGSFKTCGYGVMPRLMRPASLLLAVPVSRTASLCTASFTENINRREQCKRVATFIQGLGWRFSSMSSAALYCSCWFPRLCAHLLYCKTRRIKAVRASILNISLSPLFQVLGIIIRLAKSETRM